MLFPHNPKAFNRWLMFYNQIKEPGWPECYNEYEFQSLPDDIKSVIINNHNSKGLIYVDNNDLQFFPADVSFIPDQSDPYDDQYSGDIVCNKQFMIARDFAVLYSDYMDGHGTFHSQMYPMLIRKLYPSRNFNTCLDWCSGPGFIGFRLLSDNIVTSVTMMDRYRPALTACTQTWANRPERLKHCTVEIAHSSAISKLGTQKFDLIVSNPPNFDFGLPDSYTTANRITQDKGLAIHTEFFLNIKKNLSNDGIILLSKSCNGSQPRDHIDAVNRGGLRINRIIKNIQFPKGYLMELTHK